MFRAQNLPDLVLETRNSNFQTSNMPQSLWIRVWSCDELNLDLLSAYLSGRKLKQSADEYVAERSLPGFHISRLDLFIILSARVTLRRQILLLEIHNDLTVFDTDITADQLTDPGTLLLGTHRDEYYALFLLPERATPEALVLRSTTKRSYQVGFVAANGNSFFRALALLCKVHNLGWNFKVTSLEGALAIERPSKSLSYFFQPMHTIHKQENENCFMLHT